MKRQLSGTAIIRRAQTFPMSVTDVQFAARVAECDTPGETRHACGPERFSAPKAAVQDPENRL